MDPGASYMLRVIQSGADAGKITLYKRTADVWNRVHGIIPAEYLGGIRPGEDLATAVNREIAEAARQK